MPELPEVETVRLGLEAAILGHRLQAVSVRREGLRRPFPVDFADRLRGRQITAFGRRAKYITISLDDGWILLLHLGMSGRVVLTGAGDGRHDHVVFETDRGQRVIFQDPRRFGLMDLVPADHLARHSLLKDLGPEPLDDTTTATVFHAALSARRGPIKAALLDQTVIAGIGNIYACEALFRAEIDPTAPADTLSRKRAGRLLSDIKAVLREALVAGGSSLRDHRRPDGELGYFQHSFQVYGREGEPCPGCTCGQGIRRIVQSGRSTFYCARRQARE